MGCESVALTAWEDRIHDGTHSIMRAPESGWPESPVSMRFIEKDSWIYQYSGNDDDDGSPRARAPITDLKKKHLPTWLHRGLSL